MGLDMYLDFNRYVPQDERESNGVNLLGYQASKISCEIGYWRKANAIHKWFVDNVQGGEDNCGSYYVSLEQLKDLHDLCLKALKDEDSTLLPPTSGFFFGPTDIDDWYWRYIQDTVNILDKFFKKINSNNFLKDGHLPWEYSIMYHSSW